MQNALLPNGEIVNAREYDVRKHGDVIMCPHCKARVIYVHSSNTEPHFKTTGRSPDFTHKQDCPHVRKILQIVDTIKKLRKYTTDLSDATSRQQQIIIDIQPLFKQLNTGPTPKGPITEIPNSHPKKQFDYAMRYKDAIELPVKQINSLKTIAKLIKDNCIEKLASTFFLVNEKQLRISDVIIDQNTANRICRTGDIENIPYIVYGTIRSVARREKVMFLNFDTQDGAAPFTAYVFARHFNNFSYTQEEILKKFVLLLGFIKPNSKYGYAEMELKSEKQMYVFDE